MHTANMLHNESTPRPLPCGTPVIHSAEIFPKAVWGNVFSRRFARFAGYALAGLAFLFAVSTAEASSGRFFQQQVGDGKAVALGVEEAHDGVSRTARIAGRVPCVDGEAAGYPCKDIDLLASVPREEMEGFPCPDSGQCFNDIWGWTDPVTGVEYALLARFDGVAFFDLSDPESPFFVGMLPMTPGSRASSWRDIKVVNDHAVIVADYVGNHGMQVFDLSQLRDVTDSPATFDPTALYDAFGSAHNVVVNDMSDHVGAGEVSGQIPKKSSANSAAPDRADPSAEPAAYWIFLDGKPDAATVEISERARARRARRGQPHAAELDQSVSPAYIRTLEELGVQIRAESRWLNAVSATLTEELISRIRELDFVRDVSPLARRTAALPEPVPQAAPVSKTAGDIYGPSRTQLALMNAIAPIERGINGKGVRIGFLDAPFSEFNHPVFDALKSDNRLIAIRNFTGKTDDTSTHGMNVASTAVGYQEGELIGPAHGAEVLAGITEYVPTETNQEEDNLVAGLEWMESEGADVVNISLGYTTFDAGQKDYAVSDLDGDTGITTITADMAAALGVVVVTSAGNSACFSPAFCWYYISTPADADSVITVGAVTRDSSRASFSSFGPTADGRTKPDVSAMGASVYIAVDATRFDYTDGTSLSGSLTAAVAAQMLQVNPNLSPVDVRDILRSTAHQSAAPDNALGWGIINADDAVKMAESLLDPLSSPVTELPTQTALLGNYPNPFNPETTIRYTLPQAGKVHLAVYNLLGHEVAVLVDESKPAGNHTTHFNAGDLPSGAYLYRLQTQEKIMAQTMILVK